MDLQDIKKLNPHIKGNVLPAMPYGYELTLPANNIAYFNANREAILDSSSKRGELPNVSTDTQNPTMLASSGGA